MLRAFGYFMDQLIVLLIVVMSLNGTFCRRNITGGKKYRQTHNAENIFINKFDFSLN